LMPWIKLIQVMDQSKLRSRYLSWLIDCWGRSAVWLHLPMWIFSVFVILAVLIDSRIDGCWNVEDECNT
jgi:hypothetical protein